MKVHDHEPVELRVYDAFTCSVKKKNPNMTYYSSGEIWFDIIDVELLTPADETSCNTCLTQFITNFF